MVCFFSQKVQKKQKFEKNTFFHFLRTYSAHLKFLFSGAQYITKCLPKAMIVKIISAWSRILHFFYLFLRGSQ